MNAYVGEIRLFSFSYNPSSWLPCDGQSLPINSWQKLFSVIGNTYGSNGPGTFKLPDLRGRTPVNSANGAAGAPPLGESGGAETHQLTARQVPAHGHRFLAGTSAATATAARDNILAAPSAGNNMYSSTIAKSIVGALASGGPGVPFKHRQPFQALQYCICIDGIYPSRD